MQPLEETVEFWSVGGTPEDLLGLWWHRPASMVHWSGSVIEKEKERKKQDKVIRKIRSDLGFSIMWGGTVDYPCMVSF